MSGTNLIVEIDASQLEAVLATIHDVLDKDKVLDEATSIILNHTRQRFMQEKNPDGVPWPPSEAAIKRRRAGGTGTLRDTETLWRSIQAPATHGTDERIIEAGAYNEKGVEYGHFHQEGTKFLPVREFLGVSQSDIELFEAAIMNKVAIALGLG